MADLNTLNINIKATNNFKKTAEDVTRDAKRMGKSVKQATGAGAVSNEGMSKIREMQQSIREVFTNSGSGASGLRAAINSVAAAFKSSFAKMGPANGITQEIKQLETELDNLIEKSAQAGERMAAAKETFMSPQASDKEAGAAVVDYDAAKAELDDYEAKIEEVTARLEELRAAQENTGKPSGITEAAAEAAEAVNEVNSEASQGGDAGAGRFAALKSAISGVTRVASEAASAVRGTLSGTLKTAKNGFALLNTEIKKCSGAFASLIKRVASAIPVFGRLARSQKQSSNSFASGLKTILRYGLGIRSLFVLFNRLRSAIVEGFTQLVQFDGVTNQSISNIQASLNQLKGAAASAFAPILNAVAPILTALIDKLTAATSALGQFFAAFTGNTTYQRATKVQTNYAASLQKTTKATKDLTEANKRSVMAFDQLNKLNDNSTSSAGSGNGNTPTVGFTETPISKNISDFAKKIKDMWKKADFTELGEIIGNKINAALESIPWAKIQSTAERAGKSLATFINGITKTVDWQLVGKTVAEAINTIFYALYGFAHNLDWAAVGNAIANTFNGLLTNINWELIINTVRDFAAGFADAINGFFATLDPAAVASAITNFCYTVLNAIATFFIELDGYQVGQKLQAIFTNIDWGTIGNELLTALGGILSTIGSFFMGLFDGIDWEAVRGSVNGAIATLMASLGDALMNTDWHAVGETVGNLFLTALGALATAAAEFPWAELGVSIGQFLAGIDWGAVFATLWDLLGNLVRGGIQLIAGIVYGGLSETESQTTAEVGAIGASVGAVIGTIIGGPMGGLLGALLGGGIATLGAKVWEWIKEKWADIKLGAKEIWGKVKEWFKNLPGNIKEFFKDGHEWLKEKGGNVIKGLRTGIKEKWTAVKEWFGNLPENVKNFFLGAPNWLTNAGKNILSGLWGGLTEKWNSIAEWWNNGPGGWLADLGNGFMGGVRSAMSYVFHWNANGGLYKNGRWMPVTAAAGGGSFNQGQMFIARERGPELVGTIGGHTAVLNNDQIVASVSAGVFEAVASALTQYAAQSNGNPPVLELTITCDGETLYRTVKRGEQQYGARYSATVDI